MRFRLHLLSPPVPDTQAQNAQQLGARGAGLESSHSSIYSQANTPKSTEMATPFYRFVKSYGPPDSEVACDRLSPASPVQQQRQTGGDSGLLRPLLSSKEPFRATNLTRLTKPSDAKRQARLDSLAKEKYLQAQATTCRRQ